MICQICKKNEATVTIVKLIGLYKTELHVCKECAQCLLGETISSFSFSQYNMNEILDNLLDTFGKYEKAENLVKLSNEMNCPDCHMTYNEFIQSGKLGCSQCYEYFRKQLKPILGRLHGHLQHIGKVPLDIKERFHKLKRIKKFKNELQQAVLREEYEKAAKLRDLIIEEEKTFKNGNNE
jgi:protein arginine kinase activator